MANKKLSHLVTFLLPKKATMTVLVRNSIAVKRYIDYGNFYKGKTFTWGGLNFQWFSSLL